MCVEDRIIQALKTGRSQFAMVEPDQLEPLQDGVYHLRTTPPYFIKWIPEDDLLGNNEIWVNQAILSKASIPTPRLIFTIKVVGASIAVWEWLEGLDLRYQHRDWLPRAFTLLGHFHAEQRHVGRMESLITHHSFESVKDLLKAELGFLCTGLENHVCKKAAWAFSLLEAGYPTLVHGDAHPGNIRLTDAGLKFVDWGYCASSLNLFDLGYIQNISQPRPVSDEWWHITKDEAGLVLSAYYDACGIKNPDIDRIQWAVVFWSKLWGYHNCLKKGDPIEAETVRLQINELIAAR
jgi:hypothetical protein